MFQSFFSNILGILVFLVSDAFEGFRGSGYDCCEKHGLEVASAQILIKIKLYVFIFHILFCLSFPRTANRA